MKIGIGVGINYITNSAIATYLKGAMIWGFRSKYKWSQTTPDIWGFANPTDIDPEATAIYNRIIADGGVSNLTRLNYFVVGLKTIYATLANVPVCYDAHWIGYKLGSGTGATSGQAAAKLYSLTVAGDAVQSTAASQPLLLAHNGASTDNYYWQNGQGLNGNSCLANNTSITNTLSNIDIKVNYEISNYAAINMIIHKWTNGGGLPRWKVNILTNRTIQFLTDNGLNATSTVAVSADNKWIRITRESISGNCIFYTSTNGLDWTQLGATITTLIGDIAMRNLNIQVGNNGDNEGFQGRVYRATISNSIGGSPVVDFNPAQYNASTSQTAWTSSTGEIWTINESTGATYHGALVDRTIVMGDGIDDKLISSSPIVAQPDTIYTSFKCNYSGANTPTIYESSFLNRQFFTRSNNTLINSFAGSYLTKTANVKSLNLITNLHNGLNSDVQQNNGASTIGNMGLNSLEGLNLLGNPASSPTVFSPAIINTLIVTSLNDSLATRTATYNLIRSLNNNAF